MVHIDTNERFQGLRPWVGTWPFTVLTIIVRMVNHINDQPKWSREQRIGHETVSSWTFRTPESHHGKIGGHLQGAQLQGCHHICEEWPLPGSWGTLLYYGQTEKDRREEPDSWKGSWPHGTRHHSYPTGCKGIHQWWKVGQTGILLCLISNNKSLHNISYRTLST